MTASKRIYAFLRRNVLGLVAIFIALGGTALALPGTNTVNSGDIINGAVKSQDIADGGVASVDLANGGVTAADLAAGSVSGANIANEAWHAVQANPAAASDPCVGGTPQNGEFCGSISQSNDTVLWRNYNQTYEAARYYRDAVGQVHIEGLVQQLTGGNAGALDQPTIFRLPAGYRPAETLIFTIECSTSTGDAAGRIDILATGQVMWKGVDHCIPGNYLSLSGISFRAEG